MAVNKENVQKWVKALRSGRYKQTTGQLKIGDKYCCLGVACTVSRLGRWEGNTYLEGRLVLPLAVQKWLGLRSDDPSLGKHNASYLNDEKKLSFKEIADLIEKTYLRK